MLPLKDMETTESEHSETLGPKKSFSMGAGKSFPPPLPDPDNYVVEFEGPLDPAHPHNWPLSVRLGSFPIKFCQIELALWLPSFRFRV